MYIKEVNIQSHLTFGLDHLLHIHEVIYYLDMNISFQLSFGKNVYNILTFQNYVLMTLYIYSVRK